MAQISGVVYRDFNEDGVRSFTAATPFFGEIGVGNITVNVYNATGLVGSATTSLATATAGSYSISPTGAGPYRVEFVGLPAGSFDGSRGTASGTSVQFVATSPASNINLGINFPYDYCQPDPDFIVPCYVNGNSLGNGGAAARGVLVTLPYSSSGDTPAETPIALNNQTGTVFGVAYQREARTVFTAAFVKRHTGLGVGGAGAIYVTRPDLGTTSVFTTLPTAVSAITSPSLSGTTVVGSNTDRGLPDEPTDLNHDPITFDQVGKAGLGDLEISEDGTQLYVVNLGDRRLYRIPVVNANTLNPSAGTPTSFALPEVTQTAGSVFRPFALKYYRGLVYVGGVTTNEGVSTTTDNGTGSTGGNTPLITRDTTGMKAVVFSFDPATAVFTPVLTFPLTYQKGGVNNDKTGVSRADRWFPWTDVEPGVGTLPNRYARNDGANTSYPQAILSGIEFDVDGSMILSIRDRFGDQYGNYNYVVDVNSTDQIRAIAPGDILRAGKCSPAVEQWTLEFNAQTCTNGPTLGANTFQGPGGGEYYYGDAITPGDGNGPFHLEMSEGGLALLPGRDEVASIVLDPTDQIDAGGIRRFKNSDGSGSPATSVQIYRSGGVATFGKANGLGDIELSCDLPPIQIGNRVWRDLNNNGVQDPGEPGLAGVTVTLLGPGSTTLATAVTDANGEYYFSTAPGTSTTSSIFNLTLTSGGSYALSFPTSFSAFSISSQVNAGTGANANAIDSDPTTAGVISFTLGQVGQNNFTYDAGYACTPLALTLTSASICAGQAVSLTATAGFSSYSFSSGLTQAGITNVASGTANGTYSVTAVNSAGCSGTATGTITINQLPVVTLSSATVCAGQPASLTATPGYATYIFPVGLTQVGTSNVATGTVAGTFSVTVISSAGCIGIASGTGLGTITVNDDPVVSLSSDTVCAGQTASLTATAGFASYQFSTGLTQVNGSNVATGLVNGTYSVTATTSNGCSNTALGSITVNQLPVITLSSATICEGQTASLTATPGFTSYQFSAGLTPVAGQPNVATGTVGGTYSVTASTTEGCTGVTSGSITVNQLPVVALSSATICAGQTASLTATAGYTTYIFSTELTQLGNSNAAIGTATGTYSVTAINSAGCSATATGAIIVNQNPAITLSSVTVCAGQTARLTATPGLIFYQFSTGLTQTSDINSATGTIGGTYSVTATDDNGCSTTAVGSITVNQLPVATLSSATICEGQTASLTATPGFALYLFPSSLGLAPGQPNVATGIAAGTYSVTVVSAAGCLGEATGTITVNPSPQLALSSATICAGQTTSLTATPGYDTYVFSSSLTQVGTSNVAVGTAEGTYSVTAISSAGCSATAAGSISFNPLPVVSLSSATICAGQPASLTATPGYVTYTFSPGLTQIGNSNVVTGTVDGAYSVTAINSDGCSATATGNIVISPDVVVTLSSATICAGQIGVLTATPGYDTYIFSPGLTQAANSNVASGTVTGTYSVTALNSIGCSATATGDISVHPIAIVSLASATVCTGQSATLVATPGFATYEFSAGLTPLIDQPNVATGLVADTYSVTATSSSTCSGSATGTITINPLPTAAINVSSATICEGQSTTLTASGGDTYLWSTGEQTASIVVTTGGPYSVTVTTLGGCSDVASTTIIANPNPIITINSPTVCAGQSATLTVEGCTGGTVTWSTGENTVSILVSPTVSTSYSAICTLATGCSSTTSTSVTVNAIPSYTAAPQAITASCSGATPNNDARIVLTTLQNTERADIIAGTSYGTGPAYNAPTNVTVTAGTVSFTNLPNPATSQSYTIRLFNPGGACYTDVTVILQPSVCACPPAKCIPVVIKRIAGR
jgi:hypothetical protein